VPSASAKYALLAPILVPLLMGVGISPDLTQAAFRVGDGPVNLQTAILLIWWGLSLPLGIGSTYTFP
jgi:aminobenzoyl-glutamate transport protein